MFMGVPYVPFFLGAGACVLMAAWFNLLWLLALLSYSPQDAAWSTSGAGQRPFVHNWMGRVGAWLADACYFGFGLSIWWLVLAAVQSWMTSLLRWMRIVWKSGRM